MRLQTFAIGVATLGLVGLASAETLRWVNPSGGAWNDPANWSPMLAPTLTDDVVFSLDATLDVTGDGVARALALHQGDIALLGALKFSPSAESAHPALTIAPEQRDSARLRLAGQLIASQVEVAADGVGDLTVTGILVLNADDENVDAGRLVVGQRLFDDFQFETRLGDGRVTVAGPGAAIVSNPTAMGRTGAITLSRFRGGSAQLSVLDGGRIDGPSIDAYDTPITIAGESAALRTQWLVALVNDTLDHDFILQDASIAPFDPSAHSTTYLKGFKRVLLDRASISQEAFDIDGQSLLTIRHSQLDLSNSLHTLFAPITTIADSELRFGRRSIFTSSIRANTLRLVDSAVDQPHGGLLGFSGDSLLEIASSTITLGQDRSDESFHVPSLLLGGGQFVVKDNSVIDAHAYIRIAKTAASHSGRIDGENTAIHARTFEVRRAFGAGAPIQMPGAVIFGSNTETVIQNGATLATGILAIHEDILVATPRIRTRLRVRGPDVSLTAGAFTNIRWGGQLHLENGASLDSPLVILQSAIATSENEGNLVGNGTILGDVVNGGVITPGDGIGALVVTGSYTMARTTAPSVLFPPTADKAIVDRTVLPGRLHIDIATTGKPRSDLLAISGDATLDGELAFFANGPGLVRPGDYVFLRAGSVTGEFANVALPPLHARFAAEVLYEPTRVLLRVRARADLTGDRRVNGRDLAALLARWNTSDPTADLNDDGVVSGPDLAALLAHWTE